MMTPMGTINSIAEELAILIEDNGGRYEEARIRFRDCLTDAFEDEMAPLRERQEREQEFIDSGEAAIENKADERRQWYRDLMLNNGDAA